MPPESDDDRLLLDGKHGRSGFLVGRSATVSRPVQRGARSLPPVEANVISTVFFFILVVPSVAIFMARGIDAIRT
jgi:hypothetical protein